MALRFVASSTLRPVLNGQVRNASTATKEVLANAPAVEVSKLKNGFRVASEDNGKPTATVGVFIETGSRYEDESNNGVAHFLERMVYKGTGQRSQAQLEQQLESIGAKLNSETGRDKSGFYVQAAAGDVEKVVDILADVLRNSKLDNSAIEAERQVLLRELDESDDNLSGVVFDNLHAAAFQGTPLAKSALGTTQSLKNITGQQLKEWMEDHYRPVRMVLSAVGGGCDHGKLVQLGEKYFGDLSNDYPRKIPQVSGIRFTGSEFRYRNDNIPHMYGAIAVEGVGYAHPDNLALRVASQVVGQWDVTHASLYNAPSRLTQKIGHGHGLHLYNNFNINYKDSGLFGIYFVADGHDLADSTGIVKSVQKEWKHMSSAVDDAEIEKAKNQLRTRFFQAVETNTQKAAFNAKELLYTDSVRSLAEVEEAIAKITKNDVREAVSRNVYDRDVACAGVGRTEAWPNYAAVRYGMSHWRL